MALEGLKGYLQLASGLTDVTRDRARAVAKAMVAQGGAGVDVVMPNAVREQVGALTDDLLATGKANRDLLIGLIRAEVERAVAKLGLVTSEELSSARTRARELEDRVRELERALRSTRGAAPAKKTARKTAKRTAKKTAKKTARKTAKKTASSTAAASASTRTAPSAEAAQRTADRAAGEAMSAAREAEAAAAQAESQAATAQRTAE